MPKKDRLTRLIDDLIKKSEAATPGMWIVQNYTCWSLGINIFSHYGEGHVIATTSSIGLGLPQAVANAAYIAACTPETIREICAALGRARSDLDVHKTTIAELEAKIEEQQRQIVRQEKELASCYKTIDGLMDPEDDSGKVARLEAESAEQRERIEQLEKEADWLACKITCASHIGRQCDFGFGCICRSCAENKTPADWRNDARKRVGTDPKSMPLRGVRLACRTED